MFVVSSTGLKTGDSHNHGIVGAFVCRSFQTIFQLDDGYNCSYTKPMKTAISIHDDLFKAADAAAKRLGITRSELYRQALTAFLQNHSDRLVTQSLDRVYADADPSQMPDPVMMQMQAASLKPESW